MHLGGRGGVLDLYPEQLHGFFFNADTAYQDQSCVALYLEPEASRHCARVLGFRF